jgi:hypothetical protein
MNLRILALLAAIAETGKVGFSLYFALSYRSSSPLHLFQIFLSVPAILFFFYVWKRQKP